MSSQFNSIPIRSKPKETVDSLLKLLKHNKLPVTEGQLKLLRIPDANKVAWRNIPEGDGSDSDGADDHELLNNVDGDAMQLGGDSDVESGGDSDIEVLQSAEVWTDVETVKIHLNHLHKLKTAYLNEFDHLRHILRESRQRYLRDVAVEKQTMTSIHSQAKHSVAEREAYEQLKAMNRYHRHNGRQALMRHALLEKRSATSAAETAPGKERSSKQARFLCVFSQGSWKCGERAVPLTRHCVKHILEDPQQVLYRACGSKEGGGEPCHTPIIPLPHIQTCIYHTPLPQHLHQSSAQVPLDPANNSTPVCEPPVMQLSDSASVLVLPMTSSAVAVGGAGLPAVDRSSLVPKVTATSTSSMSHSSTCSAPSSST